MPARLQASVSVNGRIGIGGDGHIHCSLQTTAGAHLSSATDYFIRELISGTKQQLAAIDVDHDRARFALLNERRKRVGKFRERQIGLEFFGVDTSKHDFWFFYETACALN